MILVKPSYVIEHLNSRSAILSSLERYGRTCYKSEGRITDDSAGKFCKMLMGRNHLSVVEHESMTVRFICDRGVSHELIRHRLASFSQESTRYCNYKGGVTFVIPPWLPIQPGEYGFQDAMPAELPATRRSPADIWFSLMLEAEVSYTSLLSRGWTPQQARTVLPSSLKTEIVMTANLREWIHIFDLRCSPSAHPQMREIMVPLRDQIVSQLPELFTNGGEE